MLDAAVPVGAGTDATRVASYNPWIALYWMVSGRTVGGLRMTSDAARLDRTTALRLWTEGSAWFSTEQAHKGHISPGQYADLAVLENDYFSVDEEMIKALTSVLTVVGGRIVHGAQEFRHLAPPLPPAMPDWSPVRTYGGHSHLPVQQARHATCAVHRHTRGPVPPLPIPSADLRGFFSTLGCGCFAF